MLLVTSTYPVEKRFGDEIAIQILADAGFDALDYSAFHMKDDTSPLCQKDYKDYAMHLKSIASQKGISFVQAHVPIPLGNSDKVYIDSISSPWFAGCLDLGHCEVCGRKAQDVIRAMGSNRLTTLHIHDNDRKSDLYKLPRTVSMDWEEICKALAQTNYLGNFIFEVNGFLDAYADDFVSIALKFMHDTGRYFISRIQYYKFNKYIDIMPSP